MMIYQFCRLFYRFGLRLTLILVPWRSQPRHDVAAPIRIRQAAAIPKTSGPPWLPLSAQSLPVYLPASCCACACLAAVEVRQGRRPLLLGLRRRPRPVGASSAAAAPCALSHRQTPPSGPQGSSLRHEVPSRVYPNTREAMPASDTAPGSRRRPIPDARSQTVLRPWPRLHSPSPPCRSSMATHLHGSPLGALIPAVVLRPSQRRPPTDLRGASAAAGLRSHSPPPRLSVATQPVAVRAGC